MGQSGRFGARWRHSQKPAEGQERVASTHSLTLNETFAVVQFRTTGKQSEAFSQMAMSERRLNEADRNGFFAGMAQGYTDYPTLSEAQGY
jgi:hypothetical protein